MNVCRKDGNLYKDRSWDIIKCMVYLTQDAVFDVSWYEHNDKFLLIGSGNGEISFWQIGQGKSWVIPTGKSEVVSV